MNDHLPANLQGLTEHSWPRTEQHLWTGWMNHHARQGKNAATQYRTCLHPDCKGVEYREAPTG